MTRQRIADKIYQKMLEDGEEAIIWGDSYPMEFRYLVNVNNKSPLTDMRTILNALERAPELFEKKPFRGHDVCKKRSRENHLAGAD